MSTIAWIFVILMIILLMVFITLLAVVIKWGLKARKQIAPVIDTVTSISREIQSTVGTVAGAGKTVEKAMVTSADKVVEATTDVGQNITRGATAIGGEAISSGKTVIHAADDISRTTMKGLSNTTTQATNLAATTGHHIAKNTRKAAKAMTKTVAANRLFRKGRRKRNRV